jgi:membrane fusion protein (multidrug efflux system)
VAAATASVKRLTEMQGFQKVVAPFDGIITDRNYDTGALISATTSGAGAGRALFQIKQTDTLRVFVNVPQTYATEVHPDQNADLLVRNYPGKPFAGKLARTAGAIDPSTRTLRVEVDIPNAAQQLYPGMWGEVRFKIAQTKPPVVIPTSALMIGADGVRVAVVEAGDKVRFQTVDIGRDFGAEAEVVNGLTGDERVVTNPGERLADGVEVKVTSKPAAAAAGSQAKPAAQAAAS